MSEDKIVKWSKDCKFNLVENLPDEIKNVLFTLSPNFKKIGIITISENIEIESVEDSPTEHIRKLAKREGIEEVGLEFGELKREETFALNGAKLHEGYFDNMVEGGNEPSGILTQWIGEDFGSYEKWLEDFKALGLAARGWVILAMDLDDGRLSNYLCDSHNQGGVWNAVALLIMDVYEHAYFLDYATGRKAYIEAFFKNIDWAFVDQVVSKFNLSEFRK